MTGLLLGLSYKENTWTPPEVDEEKLALLAGEDTNALQSTDYMYIFKTEPYIDSIYIRFDSHRKPRLIRRFTIHEGYTWDLEDEEFFHNYCVNNDTCGYSAAIISQIYTAYCKMHPDWHLKPYYTRGIRLLDHIYSCVKKNNIKEVLYKSGLDELAAGVYELDEVKLLAGKPSDIYGGMSMKVLRSLNCSDGAKLLANRKYRSFLKELNMKFPEIFKNKLNDAQCRYLARLIDGKLTVGETGRLFSSRSEELSKIWCKSFYELFVDGERKQQRKQELCKTFADIDPIYGKYMKNLMMPYDEIDLSRLEYFLFVKREEYDKNIRRSNRKRDYDWMERGEDYYIRYPQTINDFCREAVYMGNCLLNYVEAFIKNDTTILFMRKSDDVNKPFITIEIYKNELMQAYHRFNNDCTADEANYIRDYCKRHGIGLGRFHFNSRVDELY